MYKRLSGYIKLMVLQAIANTIQVLLDTLHSHLYGFELILIGGGHFYQLNRGTVGQPIAPNVQIEYWVIGDADGYLTSYTKSNFTSRGYEFLYPAHVDLDISGTSLANAPVMKVNKSALTTIAHPWDSYAPHSKVTSSRVATDGDLQTMYQEKYLDDFTEWDGYIPSILAVLLNGMDVLESFIDTFPFPESAGGGDTIINKTFVRRGAKNKTIRWGRY